jgi:hypothetical protein
MSLLLVLT